MFKAFVKALQSSMFESFGKAHQSSAVLKNILQARSYNSSFWAFKYVVTLRKHGSIVKALDEALIARKGML